MGQAVVHWELWSDDPARIADFYQRVFGWNIRPIPERNYRVVETGGQGGINGVGQFSLFEDPDGRVLGMWKQLKQDIR